MGLVDAEREQLMAKRASLRGGVKMYLFVMAINFAAFAFALRHDSTFWVIVNLVMIFILAINITMAWNVIDKINDKLENEE